MDALIILAHGSRRKASNIEVSDLAKKVSVQAENKYKIVSHAFLELSEPSLIEAIDDIVAKGISRITVMPYFLNSGTHVTQDIPNLIEMAQEKHSDCSFNVTSCIGMHEDIPKLILKQSDF